MNFSPDPCRTPPSRAWRRRAALLALGALALAGCPSPPPPPDATTDAAADAADAASDAPPPRVCRPGTAWSPGAQAFQENSMAWGLANLNGTNFGVGDIDNDGWPDLVLMHGSPYDRTPGQVFLNRPGADGRRTFVEQTALANQLFAVRDSGKPGRSAGYMALGDIDNDGDLDAFTGTFMYLTDATRDPLPDGPEILLNDGHGAFTLTPQPTIAGPDVPMTSSAVFFDQDLDGNLDLAVGYWWRPPAFQSGFGDQPQLFRGDGAGAFADVTDMVGMTLLFTPASIPAGTSARPLFGLALCDVNDDGRLDLVGAAYGRMFNELFLADGARFREVGPMTQVGSDNRRDYSDDESYRCYCTLHTGDPYCASAMPPSNPAICTAFGRRDGRGWVPGQTDQPFMLGGNTFAHSCEDVDNDGDLDLYESNIRHPDVGSASDPSELLVNQGSTGSMVNFDRPGRDTMGLVPPINLATIDEGGQHNAAFDFDNDGRMDLYLAGSPYPRNRGWVFHQRRDAGPLQFEYIGHAAGFDHACPNGTALADFDHDGDLDLVTGTYGCNNPMANPDYRPPENQPVRIYENVSTQANWISIRLVGRGAGGANRAGLGARVRVTAGGVTQTRLLHTTSQNVMTEPEAFFGLGANCDIERIEVRWPNAQLTTQTFTGVLANYRVQLREGESGVRYLP